MSVERWRMQTDRVAEIDLTQPAETVEALRELMRSQGATRIDYAEPVQAFAGDEYDEPRRLRAEQRSALRAAATVAEGEITSTPNKEKNMNDSTVVPTADIRESIRAWALQYAAKTAAAARIVVNDAEFQEWAAGMIRRFPKMTIDKCARRWVDENGFVSVPWPDAATRPGWNVDVGANHGGEVNVSIDREINDAECQAAGVSLGVLLAVVVDVDPSRTIPEPGVTVGDYFASLPTISYWGVEQTSDADADRIKALSRVLLRAADALPAVAELSRQLGGSERSLEVPVGKLAPEVRS